ncbi:MAG: response regulator [Planctomycetota bacterium]
MTNTEQIQFVKSLRLDDPQLSSLLRTVKRPQLESTDQQEKRYSFRLDNCPLHISQPGQGAPLGFLVATIDISPMSITFLHGGYLHPDSPCALDLINQKGALHHLEGTVATCTLLEKGIHLIEVKFDEPICVFQYCPEAIQIRALLVEDDTLQRNLGKVQMQKLNCIVDTAVNGVEAVEKAWANWYDVVLMDIEMPEMNGLDATRALREKGYLGLIVALTNRTRESDRAECLAAGIDLYFPKPYKVVALEKTFNTLRLPPLETTVQMDNEWGTIIKNFKASLVSRIRECEAALAGGDCETFESVLRQLKESAAASGFQPFSAVAETIENLSYEKAERDRIRSEMKNMMILCAQVMR